MPLLNFIIKSMNYKSIDFILFITFFILTSLGVALLRFLPIQNTIIVFVGDTLGNMVGVLVASSLFIWYKGYYTIKPRIRVIFSVFVGFEVYELIQILLPWATFDVHDMIGTLLGTLIAIVINVLIVGFCLKNKI